DWLGVHGYDSRPALLAWLEPYVKARWIITAFQIAKEDRGSASVSTRAVRMSFAAERPFFPYSEPPDESARALVRPARLLRVFCLGGGRVRGAFDGAKAGWKGRAVWAGPVGGERRRELGKHLGEKDVPLPEGAWLTVFDDHSSSRLRSPDVFFSTAPDQ